MTMDSPEAGQASRIVRSLPEIEPKRPLTIRQLAWLGENIPAFAELEAATRRARGGK